MKNSKELLIEALVLIQKARKIEATGDFPKTAQMIRKHAEDKLNQFDAAQDVTVHYSATGIDPDDVRDL